MGKRYKHKKIKLATTDKDNIVGNITLESQQNRDYFYGVQQRLLDNSVEAQFRGLLMQGMLPKGHGKKEVMQTVQYQRFCELWKGDKHIRVDVIERKDLQQEDGSTKYFPVLFCNKMVKTTKRIFTVFGELKDSYEDAEALGEEIKKRTQLNWEGLGVMSKEEGGIKNEGGEGGIMGNSTDAAEVKMQYSDMFKVIIIFEGNVQKVFKTKGKKNITDLQNKLTSTKGKDVLATVLNPTGRGGDCSYSEHVPYSLAHPFINLADYRVDEGYTSNGYIIGDIIYTNKIISVTILQLPAKRIPEGDGEI